MNSHEKAAHYARSVEWNMAHPDEVRRASRDWYYRNKIKANNSSWNYDQKHYQERLQYWRERRAKLNPNYKPRLGARIPEYVENAAHLRAVKMDVRPIGFGALAGSLTGFQVRRRP